MGIHFQHLCSFIPLNLGHKKRQESWVFRPVKKKKLAPEILSRTHIFCCRSGKNGKAPKFSGKLIPELVTRK